MYSMITVVACMITVFVAAGLACEWAARRVVSQANERIDTRARDPRDDG